MHDDERAIRSLIHTWHAASEAGDVPKVLSLMADDHPTQETERGLGLARDANLLTTES